VHVAALSVPPLAHVAEHVPQSAPLHSAAALQRQLHDASNSPPLAHGALAAHTVLIATSGYDMVSSKPTPAVPSAMRP
jgi:hypothetical protein